MGRVVGAVRLTIVPTEEEAEMLCGLLRSEGIECFLRRTDLSPEYWDPVGGGWREVLVEESDLARARELLPPQERRAE